MVNQIRIATDMKKPERIGPYTLLSPLSERARGNVWLARAGTDGGKVALKLARANDAPGRERLLHESALTITLDHPNIVRVHECGAADGVTWIAMGYVSGKQGMLTLANFRQLLLALVHLHSNDIIHADINQANVLLDELGNLRLVGFGGARRQGELVAAGTPQCISPEQMRGQPVDVRTDLFAAATVLYQILTGKRPFEGTALEVMQQMLVENQAAPSVVAPGLGTSFDDVIRRGLARDRDQRYGSAFEFLSAFDAACRRGVRVSA
ncbi:MAG: serine/threonine-protein kinase [Pseudomonadota bacterium]